MTALIANPPGKPGVTSVQAAPVPLLAVDVTKTSEKLLATA